MNTSVKLSNYCLSLEFHSLGPRSLRGIMFAFNKRLYFTGLKGAIWRLLGVGRNPKNPNLCTL